MNNASLRPRRSLPCAALAALFAALLLVLPEVGARGISQGLGACYAVVIPSLFPFLFLTDALRTSLAGGSRAVEVGSALILGLAGGFPIGARGLAGCVKSGALSCESASALLAGAVNAGPAFLITGVGLRLLGSARAGGLLFISLTLASAVTSLAALLARRAAARGKRKLLNSAALESKTHAARFGVFAEAQARAKGAAAVAAGPGTQSYGAAALNVGVSGTRAVRAKEAAAHRSTCYSARASTAAANRQSSHAPAAGGADTAESQSFSLARSLTFAVEATLSLCGYVTLFSGVCAYLELALDALSAPALAKALCFSALEVTSGCAAAAETGGVVALYLACAAVSACGGCVLAQVSGICREAGLSMRLFFAMRPLHLALSLLCLRALIALSGEALPASLTLSSPARVFSYSAPSAAALFALCVAFLLCERKFNLFTKG